MLFYNSFCFTDKLFYLTLNGTNVWFYEMLLIQSNEQSSCDKIYYQVIMFALFFIDSCST